MKFGFYCCSIFIFSVISSIDAKPLFSKYELENPREFKAKFDSVFHRIEMPIAKYTYGQTQVILENAYASAEFKNPSSWKSGPIIDSICLILSKYPAKDEEWIINFYDLLARRLLALYALAPEANDSRLKHILILQTACKTESQVRNLFHGIVVFAHKVENHQARKPEWLGNATLLERNDTMLTYDTNYMPQTNICFHHGVTFDIEIFENKVWIAWEDGLFSTADTFQSFERKENGLDGDTLTDLCVFRSHLYGLSKNGSIWLWNGQIWKYLFAPDNLNQSPEHINATPDALIAVYSEDDFYVSREGEKFINRRYKAKTGDKWENVNLSPGNFQTCGDSIWFSSGNKLFLSRDNMLNIRVMHEFPKSQLSFVESIVMDGSKWYVSGWKQDAEDQHLVYSTFVSLGKHTNWGYIQPPEKSYTHYSLYQRTLNEPIWLTGGVQSGFTGLRTYIKKQDKWYRLDIPASVISWYGGYYLAPGVGGNLFLISEPILEE